MVEMRTAVTTSTPFVEVECIEGECSAFDFLSTAARWLIARLSDAEARRSQLAEQMDQLLAAIGK